MSPLPPAPGPRARPVERASAMRCVRLWCPASGCAPERDDGRVLTAREVSRDELELQTAPAEHGLRCALGGLGTEGKSSARLEARPITLRRDAKVDLIRRGSPERRVRPDVMIPNAKHARLFTDRFDESTVGPGSLGTDVTSEPVSSIRAQHVETPEAALPPTGRAKLAVLIEYSQSTTTCEHGFGGDRRVQAEPARDEWRHPGTGHEHDTEAGIVNMGGRLYDPVVGRFLSPDPLIGSMTSGESLNPYSYALNNPLRFVDPSGFQACIGDEQCESLPTGFTIEFDDLDGDGYMDDPILSYDIISDAYGYNFSATVNGRTGASSASTTLGGSIGAVNTSTIVVPGQQGTSHAVHITEAEPSAFAQYHVSIQSNPGSATSFPTSGANPFLLEPPKLNLFAPTTPSTFSQLAYPQRSGQAYWVPPPPNDIAVLASPLQSPEAKRDAAMRLALDVYLSTMTEGALGVIMSRAGAAAARLTLQTEARTANQTLSNVRKAVGADTRFMYEPSAKHSATARATSKGTASPAPKNGQEALDVSVPIKPTTSRRVSIDYDTGDFVVFDEHLPGTFHGHVRAWSDLTTDMQNALIREEMATRRGAIITD